MTRQGSAADLSHAGLWQQPTRTLVALTIVRTSPFTNGRSSLDDARKSYTAITSWPACQISCNITVVEH